MPRMVSLLEMQGYSQPAQVEDCMLTSVYAEASAGRKAHLGFQARMSRQGPQPVSSRTMIQDVGRSLEAGSVVDWPSQSGRVAAPNPPVVKSLGRYCLPGVLTDLWELSEHNLTRRTPVMVPWSVIPASDLARDDRRTTTAAQAFGKPMPQTRGWWEKYLGGEKELQDWDSQSAAEEIAEGSVGRLH